MEMYGIKRETDEVLCHGCLSAGRRLSPLTNYDLFLTLLGNKHTQVEYKCLNILLCWECHGLLRRTDSFRQRLQYAQYTLSLAHAQQITTDTLSTLKYSYKQDYDCIIKESIDFNVDNVHNDVNDEKPDLNLLITINENIDIKKEIDADNFQNDNNLGSNYSDDDNKDKDMEPKRRKKYKSDREKSQLQKIDNKLDLSDPDKYFSEVRLSEKEVEEILAREREEDICRPNKCDKCGFQFASKTELYNHGRIMHRLRATKPKCPDCGACHRTLWELELHCWRAHAASRCTLCGAVVALARDRRRHLVTHKRRYRCRQCGVEFVNKHLFAYHEKQLHSKYVCDHCGRVYALRKSLENHVIRHHLPNKCFDCDLLFTNWDRLRRHIYDVHKSAGPAYCVECDVKYATQAQYRRHLSQSAKHRPQKRPRVPCPDCGKVFSRRIYMTNHRKLFHSNESHHHCQLCDKHFVNSWSLRSHHKSVHEKIPMPKTKICSVCGRGFATNRVLVHHMRTHTGERPFACAHCSAAFAQRVALKSHLAAIHKEK